MIKTCILNLLGEHFPGMKDSLDRALAQVAITLMGTLGVVLDEPLIEIGLESFHRLKKVGAKGNPKELI
jgi:hypothetical protein